MLTPFYIPQIAKFRKSNPSIPGISPKSSFFFQPHFPSPTFQPPTSNSNLQHPASNLKLFMVQRGFGVDRIYPNFLSLQPTLLLHLQLFF